MYGWDIFEGGDHPIKTGRIQSKTSTYMKKIGLIIQPTRYICSTGKSVIMVSGLCVLKRLLEIRKMGFYGSALIKKRQY